MPEGSEQVRGDAAWKAQLAAVGERNAAAKKRGRAEREERERKEIQAGREREQRVDSGLNTDFH